MPPALDVAGRSSRTWPRSGRGFVWLGIAVWLLAHGALAEDRSGQDPSGEAPSARGRIADDRPAEGTTATSGRDAAPPPSPDALLQAVEALRARVAALETQSERQRDEQLTSEREVEALREQLEETREALAAAETRLAGQAAMIRQGTDAAPVRGSLRALLDSIRIEGALAASYNWNFNNPDSQPSLGFPNGFGPGDNRPVYPQVKHNSFQLDQARLALFRPARDEARAGFRFETLYGVSADPANGGDTPVIQQAYLSYRPPLPGGLEIRAGRWDSPLGAEIIYVGQNGNASRGLLWSFQPFNHDGVIVSGEPGRGFSWQLGVANNGSAVNFDNNNAKTALAQIGWSDERTDLRLSYMAEDGPTRGPFALLDAGRDDEFSHVVDLVAFWDPTDRVSLWLNADWIHGDPKGKDESNVVGVALAGRYALTTRTGAGMRAEWARLDSGQPATNTTNAVWLTWTLDHALTAFLTLRGEVLWYGAFRGSGPDTFFVNGAGTARTKRQMVVAITQAVLYF